MKTAVEWLWEKIDNTIPYQNSETAKKFNELLEQAKELEKQQQGYSNEDLREAYSIGWVTRERFDDLSPDIIYPKGLDYEEKQDYAFNLWLKKFKKK